MTTQYLQSLAILWNFLHVRARDSQRQKPEQERNEKLEQATDAADLEPDPWGLLWPM
jgi:hypothetical protein